MSYSGFHFSDIGRLGPITTKATLDSLWWPDSSLGDVSDSTTRDPLHGSYDWLLHLAEGPSSVFLLPLSRLTLRAPNRYPKPLFFRTKVSGLLVSLEAGID